MVLTGVIWTGQLWLIRGVVYPNTSDLRVCKLSEGTIFRQMTKWVNGRC